MKRLFPAVLMVVLVFSACDQPLDETNETNETNVIFKNNSTAKVKVYSTHEREGQALAEVPALKESGKIKQFAITTANFFISYSLVFAGIPIDYTPPSGLGQLSDRIDEGKTNTFFIPELENVIPTDTDKNQYKLSDDVYLQIQNNSGQGMRLKKGVETQKPVLLMDGQGTALNRDSETMPTMIRFQEIAVYRIATQNAGAVISNYTIESSGIDKDLPSFETTEFEKGVIYSFICQGDTVVKGTPEKAPINLANYNPVVNVPLPGLDAVSATAISGTRIRLAWNVVSGALEYHVYRSDTAGGNYTLMGTLSSNSYTVTGLSPDTDYYFKVQAINALGEEGPLSSAVSAKTLSGSALGTILQDDVWHGASIATGAVQYYKIDAEPGRIYYLSWDELYGGSGAYTGDIFVSAYMGSTYYFKGTDSAYTTPIAITPTTSGEIILEVEPYFGSDGSYAIKYAATVPNPGAPRVVTVAPNTLTVQWEAVSGATAYEVWAGTSSNSVLATKRGGDVSGLSAEISGLENGTTYYIWIKAKNSVAISDFSPSVSGKPGPAPVLYDTAVDAAHSLGSFNDLAAVAAYLSANAVSGHRYYIVLRQDELTEGITFSFPGKTVGIIIQGDTAERKINPDTSGATLFTVNTGVTLTLDDKITLRGRVSVGSGGTLVMKDGARISGNSSTSSRYGGGVYVSSGTFTMNGGEISGNTADYGGGVYVSSGTFTMSGGEISGNTSTDYYGGGGGVYVSSGTFTMNGGEISGNTSRHGGGGVYVDGGTFTMSGGEISGNTASSFNNGSGGVYVSSGTFTMSGGEISGNTSYRDGGGVYVDGGTFTMSGGEISGNTASSFGGGVYVSGGIFAKTASGGVIYGDTDTTHTAGSTENTARNGNGHAVYVGSSPSKRRNTTAGADVVLDSTTSGAAGGWE